MLAQKVKKVVRENMDESELPEGAEKVYSLYEDKMKQNAELCFSYKIDMPNNMCIKVPDFIW